jgi:hypothetical protein
VVFLKFSRNLAPDALKLKSECFSLLTRGNNPTEF